jgi:hypothetical protein
LNDASGVGGALRTGDRPRSGAVATLIPFVNKKILLFVNTRGNNVS